MKTIKKYKGISLKYNEQDGLIYFGFEGVEKSTKYVFEAERIIDEPKWENCELEGYFLDGYIDAYIGLAKANRKDIKSGCPDWLYKGEYDSEFKKTDHDKPTVFLRNTQNDAIYQGWKKQQGVYLSERMKLNNIAKSLTP